MIALFTFTYTPILIVILTPAAYAHSHTHTHTHTNSKVAKEITVGVLQPDETVEAIHEARLLGKREFIVVVVVTTAILVVLVVYDYTSSLAIISGR